MTNRKSLSRILLIAALMICGYASAQSNEIVQIPLTGPIEYTLSDGNTRVLEPSCSAGPVLSDDGELEVADPQFSFLFQMGDPRKLVFLFDGGGACWDPVTCIGTPLLGASVYDQTVNETPETAASVGGMLDLDNPDNPYSDYTKVFIPYCSADVHWGSRDATYTYSRPDQPDIEWVIKHRGSDNFLAVLHWLRTQGELEGLDLEQVRRLTVSGASAGAYGALVAMPYIAELTPNSKLSLIADAGVGVVNEYFYKTALYDPGNPEAAVWGTKDSLPIFMGIDEEFLAAYAEQPLFLAPAWVEQLSIYRPEMRTAIQTSNLDTVQVSFYVLMELLGGRRENLWLLPFEWYIKMQVITGVTEQLPNHRTFLEAGSYHTLVGDDRYYQAGEAGVSFSDWNAAMLSNSGANWDNIDVGSPFGTQNRVPIETELSLAVQQLLRSQFGYKTPKR